MSNGWHIALVERDGVYVPVVRFDHGRDEDGCPVRPDDEDNQNGENDDAENANAED